MAETKFQLKNQSVTSSIMELPIMKHFNQNEILSSAKLNDLKPTTKGVLGIIKLLIIAAMGWAAWTYAVPPIMQKVGATIGSMLSIGLVVFGFVIAKPVFRWMKSIARKIDKKRIQADPFATLEEQRKELIANQEKFRVSKGGISNLMHDMQVEASKSEQDAITMEQRILTLKTKVDNLKQDMENMVTKGGAEARNSDEYNEGNAQIIKWLAESGRLTQKLTQSKNFVQKYGSRANVLKKLGQKLVMVEASMEIKLADFDATVEMLKKDAEFSSKSRAATDAAKNAMLFTTDWELDYAMDVVTSTIASDIAITAGNLRDIDNFTSQYAMDSDELYANLNMVADKIKVGSDPVPSAKQYNSFDYKLTANDKLSANGFQDLM